MPDNETTLRKLKTLIIVPCYNESQRLPREAFVRFAAEHPDVEFLFANDGSIDSTLAVLEGLCADLQPNGGKAEAVRRAMLEGVATYSPDYIGFWDADLATPLNEIPPFVEWMGKGYDMVTGLRLMRLGAKVRRKASRHYLGRVFATCASLVLRLPVYDTQCGAKLYRAEVVPTLFGEKFITRWLFDVELLARYCRQYGNDKARTKIYEYPLYQWIDVAGSRLKGRDFLKAPLELLRIWRKYRRK